jgi:hypothetical protein
MQQRAVGTCVWIELGSVACSGSSPGHCSIVLPFTTTLYPAPISAASSHPVAEMDFIGGPVSRRVTVLGGLPAKNLP